MICLMIVMGKRFCVSESCLNTYNYLSFAGIGTVVAEELICKVEVLVGNIDAITAQLLVYLDEVEAAAGHEAAHTAETSGHRRTVGNEDTHTHHAYLTTGSSGQSREFADGASLALSSWQLFMHDLLLVHDEEYGVFPSIMPCHKEIGHIANNEEYGNEQQESTRGIPNVNEPEVALTATNQQDEQPDYAETDNQYPIDIEEDTRIGEHGHIEHPAVLTIGTQHGMCACHVVVVILLFLCHRVIIVILMQKY